MVLESRDVATEQSSRGRGIQTVNRVEIPSLVDAVARLGAAQTATIAKMLMDQLEVRDRPQRSNTSSGD